MDLPSEHTVTPVSGRWAARLACGVGARGTGLPGMRLLAVGSSCRPTVGEVGHPFAGEVGRWLVRDRASG